MNTCDSRQNPDEQHEPEGEQGRWGIELPGNGYTDEDGDGRSDEDEPDGATTGDDQASSRCRLGQRSDRLERRDDLRGRDENRGFDEAAVVEEGEDVSIITYGTMVHVAQAAVRNNGISADIIDVRTLMPLDVDTLKRSVKKTGRCLVAHEATRFGGYGAELAATIQKECFYHLEAPVERVTGFDTPYPHSLEWAYFPGPIRIGEALDKILAE